MFRQSYAWMCRQIHSPYAIHLLALFFFIEATIFFLPIDPLLMLYCLEQPKRSWFFATIATFASVSGGIFGYIIGLALWQTVGPFMLSYIIAPEAFHSVVGWFKHYEISAVLIAGFTPIPYKAVTLGAGFCRLPLIPFIACSIIARGARFYLLAFIAAHWGAEVKEYVDRYFNIMILLFVFIALMGIFALKK